MTSKIAHKLFLVILASTALALTACGSQEGTNETLLRPVAGGSVIIPPCDGSRLVSEATDVFTGYIDSDFVNWNADGPTTSTPATPAVVSDLIGDARFDQMFGPESFTPSQMVRFVEDNPNLLSRDWATLIPIKVDGERFVAIVGVFGDELDVFVFRFSDVDVWFAEFDDRVVRPAPQAL